MDGERLVATAALLPYGADFAWVSMVLVTREFRRRGLAKALMQACLGRLRAQRRAALLDATEAGEPIYRALGFTTLTRMTRWAGIGGCGGNPPPPLEGGGRGEGETFSNSSSSSPSFSSLQNLDTSTFGADRKFLLDDFLTRPGAAAWTDGENATLLRPGLHASHIGPVIGIPHHASPLLHQAIDAAPGPIVIDMLDAGADLTANLAQRGFTRRRGFCRMALGRDTLPGDPTRLLAAAGPEFG